MDGQLLPAHARVHSAGMTASPKATTARNETRAMRRARGDCQTRCRKLGVPAGHAPSSAGCGARFQRVRYAAMSDLLQLLTDRGFVQDATPGLAERLRQGPITAYVGFDPTADSLHVGNLVPVMGMAWLQRDGRHADRAGGRRHRHGGRPERQAERAADALPGADRQERPGRSVRQLERFLSFEGANAARLRNNADWLRGLPLMEFLRDTGKHFTVELHAAEGVGAKPDGDRESPTPNSATC